MRKLRIVIPNSADEGNLNAQSLTLKEIVVRLPADEFHVTMLVDGVVDPRITRRPNTEFVRWRRRASTLYLLRRTMFPVPDVYFYPRETWLDEGVLFIRRYLRLKTAIVAHVVTYVRPKSIQSTLGRTLKIADAVFGNSHYVTETVRSYRPDARTIFNGIDRRFYFATEGKIGVDQSNRLTVIYVGSFQARKRPELVVRQASRRPDVEFQLVGNGELLGPCRSLASQLGCKNVIFRGTLSPQMLGETMRKADVFLFPSILEGNPQVLGQAAACGLPSVAMSIYHPDYVVNRETGFLADSDAEVEQSLDRLLDQPELRRSMSRAAISHAKKFDWDQIAQQWANIFRDVVAKRQGDV